MKPPSLPLLSLVVALSGCATAAVGSVAVSPAQRKEFADAVQSAESAGAAVESREAAVRLQEAKSAFEYAQHLPRDPDHARRELMRAQVDAEVALVLVQCEGQKRDIAKATARSELKADLVRSSPQTAASEPEPEPLLVSEPQIAP
jgi:hypothetical protein